MIGVATEEQYWHWDSEVANDVHRWLHTAAVLNITPLQAHAEHGETFSGLTVKMQYTLASVAPLALAMFGAPSADNEYTVVDIPLAQGLKTALTKHEMGECLSMAKTLVFMALHQKMTIGHAWKHDVATVRKATSLLLNTSGHNVDFLPTAGSMKASTAKALSTLCSVFRLALHPVDLRTGAAYLGAVLVRERSIPHFEEFNLATCNAWRNGAWIVEGMATSLTCMATSLSQKQSNSSTSQQAHAWVGKAEWLILANTCCNTKICIHTCIYIYTYIHIYALPKRIETYLCLFGCGVCFQVVPLPPPTTFNMFSSCAVVVLAMPTIVANYCGISLLPRNKTIIHCGMSLFVKEQNHHPL